MKSSKPVFENLVPRTTNKKHQWHLSLQNDLQLLLYDIKSFRWASSSMNASVIARVEVKAGRLDWEIVISIKCIFLKPADVEIFAPGYRSRSQNGERTLGTKQENRPHYETRFHFLFRFVYCGFQTDYVASRLQLATGKQHDFQLYHSNFRKPACLWRFDWWQPQRSLPFGAWRWDSTELWKPQRDQ